MEPESLISREELTAYPFRVSDIAEDVKAIRRLLEDDDGGDAEDAG